MRPLLLSAKGAKCESLGQRPRTIVLRTASAESAKYLVRDFRQADHEQFYGEISRLQRFQDLKITRMPRRWRCSSDKFSGA